MSENGEIYAAGKNFTLPPALTAWTNSTSALWLSVTPTLALTATLWHTLALSVSLLLSNFAYTVLDRLSGPLLGSQRRCHAKRTFSRSGS